MSDIEENEETDMNSYSSYGLETASKGSTSSGQRKRRLSQEVVAETDQQPELRRVTFFCSAMLKPRDSSTDDEDNEGNKDAHWTRHSHAAHFSRTTNILFATLLLGLQQLETGGALTPAHHSMLEDMLEGWTRRDEKDTINPLIATLEGDRLAILKKQMDYDLGLAASFAEEVDDDDDDGDRVRHSFLRKLTSGKPFRLNRSKTCYFKHLLLTREELDQADSEYSGVFCAFYESDRSIDNKYATGWRFHPYCWDE